MTNASRFVALILVAALGWLARPLAAGPLGLPLPNPGTVLPDTLKKVEDVAKTAGDTVNQTVATVERDAAGRPLNPSLFEADDRGARVVRGAIIAIGLSDRGREAAEALRIKVRRRETLDPIAIEITRLVLPSGMSAVQAVAALRAADPDGVYDFAHVYNPAGASSGQVPGDAITALERDDIKVGMIDAGLDLAHPALKHADIRTKITVETKGSNVPTAHGTAVASLLVGEDGGFHGVVPGAELYAADAFAGVATGGTAEDIARAIAWLAGEDVPVINISVTGPKNALLEAAVKAAIARGHVIVAPVGNDGPAVGVAYPAAYDGVIAVTSVDDRGKLQIDANRGAGIAFAARGVGVRAALPNGKYGDVTGTSFASPIVAAHFAAFLPRPDRARARAVRELLAAQLARRQATIETDAASAYLLTLPGAN